MSFENERLIELAEWGKRVLPPSDIAYFGGTVDWVEPLVRPMTEAETALAYNDSNNRITAIFIRQIINEARYREAIAKAPERREHFERLLTAGRDYAFGIATMHTEDLDYCEAYREAMSAVASLAVDSAELDDRECVEEYTELPKNPGRIFVPTADMGQSWSAWKGIDA